MHLHGFFTAQIARLLVLGVTFPCDVSTVLEWIGVGPGKSLSVPLIVGQGSLIWIRSSFDQGACGDVTVILNYKVV